MGLTLKQGGETRQRRCYDYTMNIALDTFEDRIVWLLKQRGMSQKELAAQLDVSVQFLNSLVIGRRRPNVKRLTQIAQALDTSVDFLALTSDDPAPPDAAAPEPPPFYFSPEADAAAVIIDAMHDEYQRRFALAMIRFLATWNEAEDAGRNPPPAVESVPGANGGSLVLGDLAKRRTRV